MQNELGEMEIEHLVIQIIVKNQSYLQLHLISFDPISLIILSLAHLTISYVCNSIKAYDS